MLSFLLSPSNDDCYKNKTKSDKLTATKNKVVPGQTITRRYSSPSNSVRQSSHSTLAKCSFDYYLPTSCHPSPPPAQITRPLRKRDEDGLTKSLQPASQQALDIVDWREWWWWEGMTIRQSRRKDYKRRMETCEGTQLKHPRQTVAPWKVIKCRGSVCPFVRPTTRLGPVEPIRRNSGHVERERDRDW